MPTIGAGVTIGPGVTTSYGVIQANLVTDTNTNSTLSYASGANWYDTSASKLVFAGNASYISTGTNGVTSGVSWSTATTDVLNTDTHTILFMIRFNSSVTYPQGYTGYWEKIFSYNAGGSDRSPGIWRYPSNRLIHWRYDPGNTGIDISLNGSINNNWGTEFVVNTWYYIGVTKNGATATAYCNGANVGTATVANPKTAGTAPLILFEYYTASLANINNLLIYNRVLSDAEVAQNFTAVRGLYGI